MRWLKGVGLLSSSLLQRISTFSCKPIPWPLSLRMQAAPLCPFEAYKVAVKALVMHSLLVSHSKQDAEPPTMQGISSMETSRHLRHSPPGL